MIGSETGQETERGGGQARQAGKAGKAGKL